MHYCNSLPLLFLVHTILKLETGTKISNLHCFVKKYKLITFVNNSFHLITVSNIRKLTFSLIKYLYLM